MLLVPLFYQLFTYLCLSALFPGYCGADIKALCTEAALVALRRRYPQIYGSSVKLKLDVTSIVLGPGDFGKAMRTIVPASQRALAPPGRALSPTLRPLLANSYSLVLKALLRVFPHAQCTDRDNTHGRDLEPGHLWYLLFSLSCSWLSLLSPDSCSFPSRHLSHLLVCFVVFDYLFSQPYYQSSLYRSGTLRACRGDSTEI